MYTLCLNNECDKMNFNYALFRNIIKAWGCFARQKAFHRKDAKSVKEKLKI